MKKDNKKSKKQQRFTSQKIAVLEYLKKVKNHPAAEIIFQEVKKTLPRITLATVYRNLNELAKEGWIQEIPAKASRFDGDISAHSHFICERCGNILDIFGQCRLIKKLKLPPLATKVGKINKQQIYFYGYCKKCV